MNVLLTCSLLLGLPVIWLLLGYPVAERLGRTSAAVRLAGAVLAGLGLLVWNVSIANLLAPLSPAVALACLWPAMFVLARRPTRHGLGQDLRSTLGSPRGFAVVLGTLGFLLALVWPLLSRPSLVYYDGTGNHDGYFWISGADHLQRHDYLTDVPAGTGSPAFVGSITGWNPAWGRMGAEGLLAWVASLWSSSPLEVYIAATAVLFVPWVAAVYLVARTFFVASLGRAALLALVAVQPMFVFFHGNANLPNLLGMLAGAALVVAMANSLRAGSPGERAGWCVMLAVSLHALLCSYPEMAPFIALPVALLWARQVRRRGGHPLPPLAALGGALLLNPATTVRAWNGWLHALETARSDPGWANIFLPVAPFARPPAMAALSVHLGHDLGLLAGLAATALLLLAGLAGWWRARDRFGAAAIFSGAALLLLYTVGADFSYGWQKTAQFSAVFLAALLPVAAVELLRPGATLPPMKRRLAGLMRAGVLGIFAFATVVNVLESHKWSRRKFLTRDWWELRDHASLHLRDQAVAIEADSFRYRFFETMWAVYFLSESHPQLTLTDPRDGGYLRDNLRARTHLPPARPAAVLVGAHIPREASAAPRILWQGETAALLRLP